MEKERKKKEKKEKKKEKKEKKKKKDSDRKQLKIFLKIFLKNFFFDEFFFVILGEMTWVSGSLIRQMIFNFHKVKVVNLIQNHRKKTLN